MARAVLEAALDERMPAAYVRKAKGLRSDQRVPISMRIDQAAEEGYLDPKAKDAADEVAERGGRVAHGDMLERLSGESVLEDLHLALSSLERRRQSLHRP